MSRAADPTRAFTLIELLVVVAIISLLVSILLPSLSRATQVARMVQCVSQYRAQYMACTFYMEDFNGWLPGENCWQTGSPLRASSSIRRSACESSHSTST